MQDFVDLVMAELGVGESECRTATVGVMELLRERLGDAIFAELTEQLPGASEFLTSNRPGNESSAGDGLMGSLTSVGGGLLGGADSGIAGVAAAVAASGIEVSQVGRFLTLLIGYVRVQAGPDVSSQLRSRLPNMFSCSGSPSMPGREKDNLLS